MQVACRKMCQYFIHLQGLGSSQLANYSANEINQDLYYVKSSCRIMKQKSDAKSILKMCMFVNHEGRNIHVIGFKFYLDSFQQKTRLVQRRRIPTFYCILTPFIQCLRVNFPHSIFRKQSIELTFVLRQIDFPCSIISYVLQYFINFEEKFPPARSYFGLQAY